jgi:putative transcriptional regulator
MSRALRPELGPHLRELRAMEHLTQAELARRSGVTRQTIAQIERGARLPSPALAMRIATALRADPDALCHLAGCLAPDLAAWLLALPSHARAARRLAGPLSEGAAS